MAIGAYANDLCYHFSEFLEMLWITGLEIFSLIESSQTYCQPHSIHREFSGVSDLTKFAWQAGNFRPAVLTQQVADGNTENFSPRRLIRT